MTTLWAENGPLILLPYFWILVIWFTPVYIALARLRKQAISDIAKAIWASVILIVPILGALAYLVTSRR